MPFSLIAYDFGLTAKDQRAGESMGPANGAGSNHPESDRVRFNVTTPGLFHKFFRRTVLMRFILFGTLGLIGLGVQVSLFWVFHTRLAMHPLVSGGLASFIAIFVNFLLNSRITWGDRPTKGPSLFAMRVGRYYVVIFLGYIVYYAVFSPLLWLGVPPAVGNLIGVFASGLFNFVLHSLWTFRPTN